jgi:hypothetical protein
MNGGPREQTTEPLRDKIAAVLAAHSTTAHRCKCGWEPPAHLSVLGPAINAHVADAVVEALGLTEEHRLARYTGGELSLAVGFADAAEAAEGLLRIYRNSVHESRWVSGWSVVGGER